MARRMSLASFRRMDDRMDDMMRAMMPRVAARDPRVDVRPAPLAARPVPAARPLTFRLDDRFATAAALRAMARS